MLEIYAFLAVFLVQILGMSVLYPIRLSLLIRASLKSIPGERLAEFYPGIDVAYAHERFLTRYRVANTVVVVLGMVLLGWFAWYTQRPDWDEGTIGGLLTVYFFLQNFPVVLYAWFTTRFNKVHRRTSTESKRKASLQRRGLFDFVPPLAVCLAVLSYAQFVAFNFYVAEHPFPGYGGPFANIGILTVGYTLLGILAYRMLYGRKTDPLQTHSDRLHTIRITVNAVVWTCILVPIVASLGIARQALYLDTWGPFVGSTIFLVFSLLSLRFLSAPPREPQADELRSGAVHQ